MNHSTYSEPKAANLTSKQIKQIAERFRKRFHGDKENHCFDIVGTIKQLGGTIEYSITLEDGGTIDVHGPNNFKIVLAAGTSPARDIFTCAHELGHYVLHSKMGQTQIFAGRGERNLAEKQANIFAAELLMPEDLFRKVIENNTITQAARIFGVSESAARVRHSFLEQ